MTTLSLKPSDKNTANNTKKPFNLVDMLTKMKQSTVTAFTKGVYVGKEFVSTDFDDNLFNANHAAALSKAGSLYKKLVYIAGDPEGELEALDIKPRLTISDMEPEREKAFEKEYKLILESKRDRLVTLKDLFDEYKANQQSFHKRDSFIKWYNSLLQCLVKDAVFYKKNEDVFIFSEKNQKTPANKQRKRWKK